MRRMLHRNESGSGFVSHYVRPGSRSKRTLCGVKIDPYSWRDPYDEPDNDARPCQLCDRAKERREFEASLPKTDDDVRLLIHELTRQINSTPPGPDQNQLRSARNAAKRRLQR